MGLLVSDDDYGLHVAKSFHTDFAEAGEGCLAYTEILPWGNDAGVYSEIVDMIKGSSAKVVIVFAHQMHMIQLMTEDCYNKLLRFLSSAFMKHFSLMFKYACAGGKAECGRFAMDIQ